MQFQTGIRSIAALAGVLALIMLAAPFASHAQENEPVDVLLFTGGHDFAREPFIGLFDSMQSIQWEERVQPEANQVFENGEATDYDVLVFYDMWSEITEAQKQGMIDYLKQGGGLVALHHSLASYPDWPEFTNIIGGTYVYEEQEIDGEMRGESNYLHDVTIKVDIADPNHPITEGLSPFTIFDETYGDIYVRANSHLLMTTDHPASSGHVAWISGYDHGRVAYIQLGHAAASFRNPNYGPLVERAILWAASE